MSSTDNEMRRDKDKARSRRVPFVTSNGERPKGSIVVKSLTHQSKPILTERKQFRRSILLIAVSVIILIFEL